MYSSAVALSGSVTQRLRNPLRFGIFIFSSFVSLFSQEHICSLSLFFYIDDSDSKRHRSVTLSVAKSRGTLVSLFHLLFFTAGLLIPVRLVCTIIVHQYLVSRGLDQFTTVPHLFFLLTQQVVCYYCVITTATVLFPACKSSYS